MRRTAHFGHRHQDAGEEAPTRPSYAPRIEEVWARSCQSCGGVGGADQEGGSQASQQTPGFMGTELRGPTPLKCSAEA